MSRAPRNPVDSSLGFFRVWVAHLGRRFGLLQELARTTPGCTTDVLARRSGCDAATVRMWCEAAYALGWLDRRTGRYFLRPRLHRVLASPSDAEYFGGQFSYLALRSLDYDGYDALFRMGKPPQGTPKHLVPAALEATRWDHTAFLELALPRLPRVAGILADGARVLDVGAGGGQWDVRVAVRYPRSSFVGIDPSPEALRVASGAVRAARLGRRVRFVRGTGEMMTFRHEFDLAYLGEALSSVPSPGRVLRRCAAALRPGGHVVIAEGLLDPASDPRSGANPLLYAIQLDFALLGTKLFSPRDLRSLLRDAGFRRPSFVHVGGGLWFIDAAKPSEGAQPLSSRAGTRRAGRT
ncbi:MAG TPA: class I SAM-dependent methyltransferase [Thermoplasmata archaeon]|nr:class I SAM-dependent methyltransferase [Thermoplasmata archaeon]